MTMFMAASIVSRMSRPDPLVAAQVNWAQYEPGRTRGHYESFYLRANHPSEPLAFWLRYTIFAPPGRPEDAEGELWAVVFEPSITSAYVAVPLAECAFGRAGFDVRVAGATLDGTSLRGQAGDISWDLRYTGGQPPLYLLPARFYRGGFPKAKSLVARPLARFTGGLTVAGRRIPVDGWLGSQNHNWGSRHTDRYAFGQVAGFDGEPDSFLELATVRTKVGPVWIPQLTPLVLRHRGHEYALAEYEPPRAGHRLGDVLDVRLVVARGRHPWRDQRAGRRVRGPRVPQPAGRDQVLSQHQDRQVHAGVHRQAIRDHEPAWERAQRPFRDPDRLRA
jgi:hypothetical protein